jgi:GntR family transcriptional regulator
MGLSLHLPQYRRIEQALRTRIAGLRPGDPLPSDAALVEEFGVSRMTARNAMQRLMDDGLVVRRPGLGSFVAQPPTHRRADHLMTFSQEMERRGRVPTSRVLAREIRSARPAEAAALRVARGDPVVIVRRVRCADGQPMAVETAVLIAATAPHVMQADLEHGSLHGALAAGGFQLRRGSASIVAEPASRDDATLLGVRAGVPLLVERRTILDALTRPVEATESRYAGDRYALSVSFEVEGPGRAQLVADVDPEPGS